MKISELSPDLRSSSSSPAAGAGTGAASPLRLLLADLDSSVLAAESLTPSSLPSSAPALAAALRRPLSRLSSAAPLPAPVQLSLWKLSYRLWNACVDLSNAAPAPTAAAADLRQIAADLLLLAGSPAGIPSPAFKSASFFHRTGLIWHDLSRLDLAASCFERAADLTSSAHIDDIALTGGDEEKRLLLDINLARSRTAWESADHTLALALLARSKNLLFGSASAHHALAEQYLTFGKLGLANGGTNVTNLLTEALELCEKGIAIKADSDELRGLKGRCLRFLSADRLQAEDYEGVLKCVRVLRAEGGGKEHASVGFVAMRAWLGAGRVAEAEKELKGMMVNKEVPEAVCVSAAEAYLAAAGPEAAMGVLMGLVSRCRAGAGSALRVVRRVAEGGGGGRAKVVAELASDERVVVLFHGAAAVKERNAMHALLWNCGADHFRSKDYGMGSEMFEKSMLYVPRDEESRSRRANCFRVLSLCHLALHQLDRAQEFINEADKLEPNIKSAFLKFKIYLQMKDDEEAIKQMQAMVSCIDFNPQFLTLSTHEAIACQSLPAAAASLSILLNLYTPGKQMPMPEVAVLRNLITLLHRDPANQREILKHTKHAKARMKELGVECFFGNGAAGSRELNWFADNSWNMGMETGKKKKYESSTEFFELASEFYGAIRGEGDGSLAKVCKCLIMSAATMINLEEQTKVTMPDSSVKKAADMLGRAGKILPSVLASTEHRGDIDTPENSSLLFLHTYNTYQILSKLDRETTRPQQLQLIKSYAGSKCCTASDLLQLGLFATQGGRPNTEAAEFAFTACLSKLLASPSPDYQTVGIALRKLAGLAGLRDTDGVFGVFKQAYQIIVGLKKGEFPSVEGKWLATMAWNRSGMAVRLGQAEAAKRWMKMGLDLARHVHGMEGYVGGMEETLSNFENPSGSVSGGTDEGEGSVC